MGSSTTGATSAGTTADLVPAAGGDDRLRRRDHEDAALRGRHVAAGRAPGLPAAPVLALLADTGRPEDRLALAALRVRPTADLDVAQVAALAGLPPSIAAMSLDRLARSGIVQGAVVDGRVRFGLS